MGIGPERFETMVTGAIDNITGFSPAVGDIRKFIPPANTKHDGETKEAIARSREEWERERETPEYKAAWAQVVGVAKKHGIKVTGEFEKSRTRIND